MYPKMEDKIIMFLDTIVFVLNVSNIWYHIIFLIYVTQVFHKIIKNEQCFIQKRGLGIELF